MLVGRGSLQIEGCTPLVSRRPGRLFGLRRPLRCRYRAAPPLVSRPEVLDDVLHDLGVADEGLHPCGFEAAPRTRSGPRSLVAARGLHPFGFESERGGIDCPDRLVADRGLHPFGFEGSRWTPHGYGYLGAALRAVLGLGRPACLAAELLGGALLNYVFNDLGALLAAHTPASLDRSLGCLVYGRA
jgi:hypothetical protein